MAKAYINIAPKRNIIHIKYKNYDIVRTVNVFKLKCLILNEEIECQHFLRYL